jgi:hypothetical protein
MAKTQKKAAHQITGEQLFDLLKSCVLSAGL